MEKVSFTDRIGTHTMYRIVNEDGSIVWFAENHEAVKNWLEENPEENN